jgi:hypothetical protein
MVLIAVTESANLPAYYNRRAHRLTGAQPNAAGLYRFLGGSVDFSVFFTNPVQGGMANPAFGCESG